MRFSLIILMVGLGHSLFGQFNISVGYTAAYTPAEQINNLVFKYNESLETQNFFGDEMPDLHFLHGLSLGTRWKFERVSVELAWERMNRTRESIGENNLDQLISKTIFYNINSYTIGLESDFGTFGLGLGLGLRNFEVKEELANTGKRKAFLEDRQYFLKPSISINLGGGEKIGLTIRPYLKIPLSNIDLKSLSDEFELVDPPSDTEPLWIGGVSFIFYNGTQ